MSRIKRLFEEEQARAIDQDDYEYQYNEWRLEQEKKKHYLTEYEIRILEENQTTN